MAKVKRSTSANHGKILSEPRHHVVVERYSGELTKRIILSRNTVKLMKNIPPIRMMKRRRDPKTFLVFSIEKDDILGMIEFPNELGTMRRISIKALATARSQT